MARKNKWGQIFILDISKPLSAGVLKKRAVEIMKVFFCKATRFAENRGFCSRIKNKDLTPLLVLRTSIICFLPFLEYLKRF
ncbi:MAG: hypothetical protein FJ110_15275 [Deltaproteobacteria bacterium]|nr:hypothetical protein [Deltaproteobacteria bacterium]